MRPDIRASGALGNMIGWAMSGQLVYVLGQFALLALLTRHASVEDIGRFGLAGAIATPVFFFFNLGLRYNTATDLWSRIAFVDFLALRLIATILGLLVVFAIAWLLMPDPVSRLILIAFALAKATEAVSDLAYGVFQKHGRLELMARSMMLRSVGSVAVSAAILIPGGSVQAALAGMFLAWLSVCLVFDLPGAVGLERSAEGIGRPALDRLRRLALGSLPLGIEGLLVHVSTGLPRLLLAGMAGLEALGYFTTIAYVYQAATTLQQSVNQAILGRLAEDWQSRRVAHFYALLVRLSVIVCGVSLVAAVLAVPLGPAALSIAFGPDYSAHAGLLSLMFVAMALTMPYSVLQTGLMAQRRFGIQAANRAIYAALLAASCYLAIAAFGMEGAALGLAVAASVLVVVTAAMLVRSQPAPDGATTP
ncbi:hypothetical protein OCH239_01315 [Roseivivax halodurans JCM 10272]|uniref:Polysaccharide biosynthesis protein n=1 Tax=Roseivivax halodurans JCM 10272 TaxID=1449350 RepID=X7ENI1_9RHOB|nr:oligosaccharide flippase family protein [Roseivivax halodurans]ETX16728.1 hypothetical protein OCH239_01315 [Roseivivax halodurans JCM 10272]